MTAKLPVKEFLELDWTLIDVRSPAEFAHGHMPGAENIPLFADSERAEVGTLYKKEGKDAAVELGLTFAGAHIADFVSRAKKLAPDKKVKVHCWRGGMRSGSMAWLFETAGFQVVTLDGGYKSYRKWVRDTLSLPKKIVILAGMTGTGKTPILEELKGLGEQVLDLEKLASHRGSSFGNIGLPPQPSTEEFENLIADKWQYFSPEKTVWLESESMKIGTCVIPPEILAQMANAPAIQIDRPVTSRIDILLNDYGSISPSILVEATERISKKLGGDAVKTATTFIRQGNIGAAIGIILGYYDKSYEHAFKKRKIVQLIEAGSMSAEAVAAILVKTDTSKFFT